MMHDGDDEDLEMEDEDMEDMEDMEENEEETMSQTKIHLEDDDEGYDDDGQGTVFP